MALDNVKIEFSYVDPRTEGDPWYSYNKNQSMQNKEGRSTTGCFFRDGTSSTSMSEEEIERRLIASLQEDKLSLADIQSFLIDKRLWFITVLPYLNYKKESLKDNVSQNDLEIIIKSIKENPRITREELAAIIGKSVKTVARIIKDSKLINFVASSKSGHWEVVEYKKDN